MLLFLLSSLLAICLYYLHISGTSVRVLPEEWPLFETDQLTNVFNPRYNTLLRDHAYKIARGQLKGPETCIISPSSGLMYGLTKTGDIMEIDIEKDVASLFINLPKSRPLGGAFAIEDIAYEGEDGHQRQQKKQRREVMYIADAVNGLMRVDMQTKEVTHVAKETSSPKQTPISFANDVVVSQSTGLVYFTDSTDIKPCPYAHDPSLFNTLGASILDALRGKRAGRILVYDPKTHQTVQIADNLWFANGITISKDEEHVLVCETFQARVLKYYLAGEKKGSMEVFSQDLLPGYCDGINYSEDESKVYIGIPSGKPAVIGLLQNIPDTVFGIDFQFNIFIRNVISVLPDFMRPKPQKIGIVLALDGRTGKITGEAYDPEGTNIELVTAVTQSGNKLFLGSLTNEFVGVVSTEKV
jgi:hypothetical protein